MKFLEVMHLVPTVKHASRLAHNHLSRFITHHFRLRSTQFAAIWLIRLLRAKQNLIAFNGNRACRLGFEETKNRLKSWFFTGLVTVVICQVLSTSEQLHEASEFLRIPVTYCHHPQGNKVSYNMFCGLWPRETSKKPSQSEIRSVSQIG